jgi:hypothetical protein
MCQCSGRRRVAQIQSREIGQFLQMHQPGVGDTCPVEVDELETGQSRSVGQSRVTDPCFQNMRLRRRLKRFR